METAKLETNLRTDHFQLRPVTMDDLEAAVDLFNACSRAHFGQDEFDLAEVQNEWETPQFDIRHDARIIETADGRIAGYIEVWDLTPHVRQYVWGRVHPEFRGRRLGVWLLDWADSRVRMSIRRAPAGTRVVAVNQTVSTDESAKALFVDRGYEAVRSFFYMAIDMDARPPEPRWPAGLHDGQALQVRTMQPGEERAVLEASREAFRDHWGFVDRPFEEDLERWMHWIENDPKFDAGYWFLALDGAEIAGVSLGSSHASIDPDMGWINTLAVRRPWRRRGLGLALLQHSFGHFYRQGILKVGLGVDAQNLTGATRLYEKAGMHVSRQFDTYEKELRAGEELATETFSDGR